MRLFRLLQFTCLALSVSVSAANVPPEIVTQGTVPLFRRGGASRDLELSPLFRDPDVPGSAVRVSVRIGATVKTADIALFDSTKPITVANFVKYTTDGNYRNNFIHRSVPGFIVQGGGFRWSDADAVESVPTFAQIQNEPGISNLRGTVAMAKLGGSVNSATSQWFVNLADNSVNLDAQNGGFTVFARVIGDGMTVFDEIAALPRVNAGSPFDTLPVKDFTGGSVLRSHTVETNITRIAPLSFSAISDDPAVVSVSLTGSSLRFTPASDRLGATNVRITATDLEGGTVSMIIPVSVEKEIQRSISGAYTGAQPPAGATALPSGSLFSKVSTPAVSDAGDVAAKVVFAAGRSTTTAIYSEDSDGLGQMLAWQGEDAPGAAGAKFKSFYDPVMSPSGKVAFVTKLSGVSASGDEGVWSDLFGSVAPLLREGGLIPGLGGLKLKSVLSVTIEDDALIALVRLAAAPGAVSAANDLALVRITGPSSGVILARTGATFFGVGVTKISVLQPAKGSEGQGRWHGDGVTVARLTLADKRSVLVEINASGAQTALMRTNEISAELPERLSVIGFPAFSGDALTVLAKKSIQPGVAAPNDTAIFSSPDGVEWGEAVGEEAGVGGFFGFLDPVTNAEGDVLFYATRRGLGGAVASVKALWLSSGTSEPAVVAALGSNATDADGVAIPDTRWSKFISYSLPDGGGPAFIAQLSGNSVTAKSNRGLWAVDAAGDVRQLLRTGEDITLPTGVKRVTGFTLLNALPGSFGARRSYSSTGIFAVQAIFSDGSQAVLRIQMP